MKDQPDDAPVTQAVVKINRFLPYWAVFLADVQQTLRSWVYRVWVLLSALVAGGYLLYRFGAYDKAGIDPAAYEMMSDLLRWSVLGSITLIIVLTTGSISGELGTLADSVLSRGISRYQYFLGKWHARLAAILGTYLFLSLIVMLGAVTLLRDEHISVAGTLVALGIVATLLSLVITCGVTVSALTSSTVLGIALVWMLLYGTGFALSLLPHTYPAPDRMLRNLPNILRGMYDLPGTLRLMAWSGGIALAVACLGLIGFTRRDV